MPIKNYSTGVAEEKTVGEIMGLLAAKGARHIQITYDEQARPSGIAFVVSVKTAESPEIGVPIPFKLPCNFDGVFKAMESSYKDWSARNRFRVNPESKLQARRVAWRIIKDWVAAQMALIEAEQASLIQVFLPYAVQRTPNGGEITMYDRFLQQALRQKALPEGETPEEGNA